MATNITNESSKVVIGESVSHDQLLLSIGRSPHGVDESSTPVQDEHGRREVSSAALENKFRETRSDEMNLREYDRMRRIFWIILGISIGFALVAIILIITSATYWLDIRLATNTDVKNYTLSPYSTHALMMTLSLAFFANYGILLYRVFPEVAMWMMNWIHGLTFFLATILFVFGVLKSFNSLETVFLENFSTLHSWVGLAAMILFLSGIGTGCGFICFPEATLGENYTLQKVHKFIGFGFILLSSASVLTGIDRMICLVSYSVNKTKQVAHLNSLGVLMISFYLVVFLMMFSQRFARKARPNWTCIYNNPSNHIDASEESSKTLIQKPVWSRQKDTESES